MAQNRLTGFLDNGGKLYIENGDIGYAHRPGASYYFGLWDYLGCNYHGDGGTSGNVSELNGGSSWYGSGMEFGYPYNQAPDNYIDILSPADDGVLQFDDQITRGRVISNVEGDRGYRVVTSAVIFGAFIDETPMSTRQRMMARIMAFLLHEDEVPPEQISGATVEIDGTSLILSWDPVADDAQGGHEAMDSYTVERTISLTGRWIELGSVVDTQFTDTPSYLGDPSDNCYYRIRAVDTAGNIGDGAFLGEFDFQLEAP